MYDEGNTQHSEFLLLFEEETNQVLAKECSFSILERYVSMYSKTIDASSEARPIGSLSFQPILVTKKS